MIKINRKIFCPLLALTLSVLVIVVFVIGMSGTAESAKTSGKAETSKTSGETETSKTSGEAKTSETARHFWAMDKDCGASAIVVDKDGTFLVADQYNKVIWRVRDGVTEQYAGMETESDLYGKPLGGYVDGRLEESVFGLPWAMAPFLDGWAVSDTSNNVVRLIRQTGVETINGQTNENISVTETGVAFDYPTGLAADDQGNLYVSDTHRGAVRKITKDGMVTTVADNLEDPMGLCWSDDVLYIVETGANRIVMLNQNGQRKTLAGSGEAGCIDGIASKAQFSGPQCVTAGSDGMLYVSDTGNGVVRCISGGKVTTLATEERLFSPSGLLVQDNTLFICDSFIRRILKVELEEEK